ncbi:MAG TPA: DUF551 domain-containing protein [Nitrospiraceae bacterium]|nr:DUF551 domain-containing protein [Nitrospiraceae bacterium]
MEPYRVEIDNEGCRTCAHDKTWHVIGPDEIAESTSYGDEEDAHWLCRALNSAYTLGQSNPTDNAWVSFATRLPPENSQILIWDAEYDQTSQRFYYSAYFTPEELQRLKYTHWRPALAGPPKLTDPPITAEEVKEEIKPVPHAEDDIPF